MTDARQYFRLHEDLPMHRGGSLTQVRVAFETWGTLNHARSNAVMVFTGLSPSAHAASSVRDPGAGWWEDMIGPGKPVDTTQFFVICFNSLGSCFGTTGPASKNPATGQPYRLDFPALALEDIAQTGASVLDHLEIEQLACVIGPSMGGMTALAFSVMFPARVRHLVSISSATRATPFAIALRSLQRELVRSDPDWQDGAYARGGGPVAGMRLARKLGMITYRSAEEWQRRFGRERIAQSATSGDMFGAEFEVESYLRAHSYKFTGAFDANCYLYLSRASDLFDLAEHGGSLGTAVALLELQSAMVIGVHTDVLFAYWQQEELAQLLGDAGVPVSFHGLDSLQGHDSFLVDMDRFRPLMSTYMNGLRQ